MGVAIGIISLTLIYIIYRRITKANRRKNKGKYKNLENPSDSEPIRKSIPDWDTSSFNEGSFTQELELAQQEEESPSFSQDEKETDQIEGVMFVCIKESFPTKKDELKIRVGDTLQMQMVTTLRFHSSYRVGDVERIASSDTTSRRSSIDSNASSLHLPPRAPEGEGTLLFSMVNADKALAFLETLDPSIKARVYQDGNANDKSESAAASPEQTRVQRNWSRLRDNWKTAARAEIGQKFQEWESKHRGTQFWKQTMEVYRI
ncbi:hypothetical protein HDV02_001351 [Globomyces sp. JEL0801]|nr:hypothetical protein HDV02_001351 [Globomyces sp. JEL0801]